MEEASACGARRAACPFLVPSTKAPDRHVHFPVKELDLQVVSTFDPMSVARVDLDNLALWAARTELPVSQTRRTRSSRLEPGAYGAMSSHFAQGYPSPPGHKNL